MLPGGRRIRTSAEPRTSDFLQLIQIRTQNATFERQVHGLSLSCRSDEPGCFELLEVVRKRRGADVVRFEEGAAGSGFVLRADLFQELQPARLSERSRDAFDLAVR